MKTAEEQAREFWPSSGRLKYGSYAIVFFEKHKATRVVLPTLKDFLAFTDQRKQEIAECENALQWGRVAGTTMVVVDGYRNHQQAAIDYTRKLLEARLAELKRGTVLEEKADGQ